MTNDELDAIEARANAATVGPWVWDEDTGYVEIVFPVGGNSGVEFKPAWDRSAHNNQVRVFLARVHNNASKHDIPSVEHDGSFIAHARTDVPALVAEVRRLRAEIAAGFKRARECSEYAIAEGSVSELVKDMYDHGKDDGLTQASLW